MYVNTTSLSIHLFMDNGLFPCLDLEDGAAMNTGVHISFQISITCRLVDGGHSDWHEVVPHCGYRGLLHPHGTQSTSHLGCLLHCKPNITIG